MCLLILIRGLHPDYPVLVASNRDERRGRKASPPGLFVGEHNRILSPRDRVAAGTWVGINEHGLVAGITNVAGPREEPRETTRGLLPHLALDARTPEAGVDAVRAEVERQAYSRFQLVVADAKRAIVLFHSGDGSMEQTESVEQVTMVSNEHRLGELTEAALHPSLGATLSANLSAEERLRALQPVLAADGSDGRHRVFKDGLEYGTVSSSLIAVPASDPAELVWLFATVPAEGERAREMGDYRDYGNLGRRLKG